MVHGILSLEILFISLIAIFFSYKLLISAIGPLKIPLASSYFMFFYLLIYIGSIFLNVWYDRYSLAIGMYKHKDILLTMWYFTTIGLFLIPFGMIMANITTGYKPVEKTKLLLSKNIEIQRSKNDFSIAIIILILIIITLLVLILYLRKLSIIPIVAVFRGASAQDIAFLRSASSNAFPGKIYRYNMLMRTMPFYLLLVTFFLRNRSKFFGALFYTIFLLVSFTAILDCQKGPIIKVFLILFIAYFYEKNKISKKLLIVAGLISIGLIFAMYIYIMGMYGRTFFKILSAPIHRIFLGQVNALYHYFEYVPKHSGGFLRGASFPNPHNIFPFEYRRLTVEIKNFVCPWQMKYGIIGSMPTVFFGEWWANFGTLGAIFSMILLGFMIQLVDIFFITKLSKHKTVLMSALFMIFINQFSKYAGTSFTGIIFEDKLIIPIFTMFFIIFSNQILRASLKRRVKYQESNLICPE